MTDPGTRRRNLVVVVGLVGLVAGMTGLSFAAVPLYDMFCRVTGFGGTTQVAESPAERVLQRRIRIRFNADVNQQLPWDFRPEVREVALNVGESALVSYRAHNRSDQPVVGHAV
ncbi:MAG TPA: cytochrome c oxidase assembly protein, partial [Arenibaculum sp.]|nr:cytochrome c oxidase assembly protein [Arenibaculum sp.]